MAFRPSVGFVSRVQGSLNLKINKNKLATNFYMKMTAEDYLKYIMNDNSEQG